jgi:hypothetical protein
MYLYCMTVPGARFSVTNQRGLAVVYLEAESVTALLGFQLPSAAIEPEIFIVWP